MYVLATNIDGDFQSQEDTAAATAPANQKNHKTNLGDANDELNEEDKSLLHMLTKYLSEDNKDDSPFTFTVQPPTPPKPSRPAIVTDDVTRPGRGENLITSSQSHRGGPRSQLHPNSALSSARPQKRPPSNTMNCTPPYDGGLPNDDISAPFRPGSLAENFVDEPNWLNWAKDEDISPGTQEEVDSMLAEARKGKQTSGTNVGGKPFVAPPPKPTKRKLSFGAALETGERRRIAPPQPSSILRSSGSEISDEFINSEACGPPLNNKDFQDIWPPVVGFSTFDEQSPSTIESLATAPTSPFRVRDVQPGRSYPKCSIKVPEIVSRATGDKITVFEDLSETYLDSLRKKVDPKFENVEHWGDNYYLPEDPIPFGGQEDQPDPYEKGGWSNISRGLQAKADRIPMPDTKTLPEYTEEQTSRVFGGLNAQDHMDLNAMAYLNKRWMHSVSDNSGDHWRRMREQLPDFVRRTPQIRPDPDLKAFCKSATFLRSRVVPMPDSRDSADKIGYASLPIENPPDSDLPFLEDVRREMRAVSGNHLFPPSSSTTPTPAETFSRIFPVDNLAPVALQNSPYPGQFLFPTQMAHQLSLKQRVISPGIVVRGTAIQAIYQRPAATNSNSPPNLPRGLIPFKFLGQSELAQVRDAYALAKAKYHAETRSPSAKPGLEPSIEQLQKFYENRITGQMNLPREREQLSMSPGGIPTTPQMQRRPMSLNGIMSQGSTRSHYLGSPLISPPQLMHRYRFMD